MNYWHQITMVRLAVSFIIGILIALALDVNIHIPLLLSLTLFALYSLFVFWSKWFSVYKYRWIHGLIISVSLILSGYEWSIQKTGKFEQDHITNFMDDSTSVVIGTLTEPINERENSYRSTLKVTAIQQNGKWINAKGNVLIYLAKDSLAGTLAYGDEVLINASISEVRPPQNPGEFNYKYYLEKKAVYHQAFLKAGNIKVLAHNKGNPLVSYANYLQSKMLKVLKDNNIDGDEYAVVAAMLLGSRDKIDADLISAYSGSGAVHILSVSGLHVGRVYVFLNFLLFFMDRNKYSKLFKLLILLAFIWFYAAITGFSAAVLRSTTMFSFLIIGNAYNRKVNGFNTLAASLFFLLIIDPYLLIDTGFQLSYLAVIGIMAIYPGLYKLWSPNYWLMDKIWGLICVSIAAQLVTAPLAMYYFHQFPNLFILTNLVIIPLTTLIMYVGVGFYILSFIPLLSVWVSKLLSYLVYLLNETVKFVDHLPYAVSRGISISRTDMLLMFAVVVLFLIFFYSRQKKFFFAGLFVSVIIAASALVDKTIALNNRKFIVYNINHHSVYDFIDGQQSYLIADSALLKDNKKIGFHIQNNWCALGIVHNNYLPINDTNSLKASKEKHEPLFIRDNFIQFREKRIAIVNNKNCNYICDTKLRTDYLIIAGNPKISIQDIAKQYTFQKIIIDSSNSLWRTNKWLEECRELNIEVWAVLKSGAFVMDV
jgi:competence protein ComEC